MVLLLSFVSAGYCAAVFFHIGTVHSGTLMLNYIWAGLIILSLVFALTTDFLDLSKDTYRNGQPLPLTITFPDGYNASERSNAVSVLIEGSTYQQFYGVESAPASSFDGVVIRNEEGAQLRFAQDASLPEPLATIRSVTSARYNDLRAPVVFQAASGDSSSTATIMFAPVRFVKLSAITEAAFDFAETAVSIALSLIGALALWLGLLRIAEKSGLVHSVVKLTQPLLRPLFPQIPKDHPALGMIVLNLTANMLGLGNAATPLGIKAMEELQKLNPEKDTATDSMVMLLAMNTASVQIVPPVLLVAIMGLQINQLFFAIIIVTFLSAVVAITAAKLLGRRKKYRDTDPMRLATESGN